MQRTKAVSILSSALLFAACGKSSNKAENPTNQNINQGLPIVEDREDECIDFNYDANANDLSRSLNEYIRKSPNCTQPSEDPACQTIEVQAELTKPWCQSKGQRVLLLETGVDQASLRHQRRVIGSYKWNLETGKYDPVQVKFRLQKGLYEYFNILNTTDGFFPSMYFNRADFEVQYTDKFFEPSYTTHPHGFNIFHFIADYAPYSQFVLADVGRMPKDVLCANNLKGVEQFYSSLSKGVVDVIERHGISFINMSNGLTREILNGTYLNSCARRADKDYILGILRAYTGYLSEISKQAVVIQAGLNQADRTPTLDDPDYYSDCTQVDGRLRVGYLAKRDAGISSDGGNWSSHGDSLNAQQKNVKSCIDAFINTGWNEGFVDLPHFGDYPLLFSFDGLFGGPLDFMSTSYAAPAMLSYLIHYKMVAKHSGREFASPNDLIKAAVMKPQMPVFLDPARFGQFEICRLSPEYCANWESFTLKN